MRPVIDTQTKGGDRAMDAGISMVVYLVLHPTLYDAVIDQARRAGATLDACYRAACADAFAQFPAVVGSPNRELRAFHLDDRGSILEQRLILAHLVLSPDLYATVVARARDLHTSPDALCRDLCLGLLQAKTGVANTPR
jgi:hypothetical protein